MVKTGNPTQAKKRQRQARPYQDKGKMRALLAFDTEESFDAWRASELVKPWWDLYVKRFLETDLNKDDGKKVVDEPNLLQHIREGEKLGKRRFLSARNEPSYDNALDFHAWLVFWLAEENSTDRNGCFWKKRFEKDKIYSNAHKYVIWAKRQRHREFLAAKNAKSPKTAKQQKKMTPPKPVSEEEFSAEEEEDMDPEKGVAIVRWTEGMPDELVEAGHVDRITIDKFCGHSLLSLWQEVDAAFDLSNHMLRRVSLTTNDDLAFRDAQLLSYRNNKSVIYNLKTEAATIAEEAQHAPESDMPEPEGDTEDDANSREGNYRSMVDEAVDEGASRFDMGVRLWRYNMMLAEAKKGDHVALRDVTLDLADREDGISEKHSGEVQAIQYTHDTSSLNKELSDPDLVEGTSEDGDQGLPLSSIKDITPEEIERYHQQNKWIDNPDYQPQNHLEACKNLGIANPDLPRIEGLFTSIKFEAHQPTAINALVEFENSCVGAGLLAEEFGLGKTVITIGLLLFRSNQRRDAIKRGEVVPKALPTLIVLPQTLIPQWRDEILGFTDRFTIVVYYGPPRNSGNEQVTYIPKSEAKGRLTRSHEIFQGDEKNSDVIVLTSYSTYTTRHGPKQQWKWLIQERRKQITDNSNPTNKQVEKLLMDDGTQYYSVDEDCPHQLFGLFERVILDEGHMIRLQSDEVGWAISNIGSKYRHIISGTPTFNGIEEFEGIMHFLQNPKLKEVEYLRKLDFTNEELTTGSHQNKDTVTALQSALLWVNPYELEDTYPRATLKYCREAMRKYIFNKACNEGKGYSIVGQGRLLSQVLKKIMVRRTHSSVLNGVPIGKSLPSVQRIIFECDFTETERAHYEVMLNDTSTKLFKKSKDAASVEWNTTTYRKMCLLASWLGFQYLLNYKASKLGKLRKNMSALGILLDLRKGQDRLKVPKNEQIPVNKDTDPNDVQLILGYHCTGSPKLRKLLSILAELVVLRKEKALIWVNNPAQAEWLEHVLKLCGIDAAQLRADLRPKEQDDLLRDFNTSETKGQVLICSYMVSCSGLNLQKMCRNSIEYEPPPNESVRQQELGRVRRRGQPSTWVRHITLLTKDTLNTKQDSDAILKNLPNLLTQLNMEVWGKGDEEDQNYRLGDFVLHEGKLCPADDPEIQGLNLKPLDVHNLLVQIQMQLLGRKPEATVETLREQAKIDSRSRNEKADVLDPLWA